MKPETLLNILGDYKKAGYLHAIDVEFARYLWKSHAERSSNVLLAACLASYLYRQGHVCLSLEDYASTVLFEERESEERLPPIEIPNPEQWIGEINDSSIAGKPGAYKPLILDEEGRLYLQKLWVQERTLEDSLLQKAGRPTNNIDFSKLAEGLNRLFPSSSTGTIDWQKIAAATAVLQPLVMISGGPGTGKTTTVVRILALFLEQFQDRDENSPEIALAAPTGKAAARLKSAISGLKKDLRTDPKIIDEIPDNVVTVHRLLGARLHSDSFTYHKENRLPHDLVIVDEVSMVDQRLMNSLMQALKPTARLILLGDKDQLASVEAGSVLGDVCAGAENIFTPKFYEKLEKLNLVLSGQNGLNQHGPLIDHIILLDRNYRFAEDSGITQLVASVKMGEAGKAVDLLQDESYEDIQLIKADDFAAFWDHFKPVVIRQLKNVQRACTPAELLNELQKFKILCAHRRGPFGIENINRQIEKMLRPEGLVINPGGWYEGRPVIIRSNSYQLQLRNGDMGVCRRAENSEWEICFPGENELASDGVKKVHPDRLPAYDIAYALTIHQSQGSEFEDIAIVLPNYASKILTRELFYTAISRARRKVQVIATDKILQETISHKLMRHSGLRDRLWQ